MPGLYEPRAVVGAAERGHQAVDAVSRIGEDIVDVPLAQAGNDVIRDLLSHVSSSAVGESSDIAVVCRSTRGGATETRSGLPQESVSVRDSSLEARLKERVDGEVRFDAGSRATYSTDASNYRQVPIGVVLPETVEGAVQAIRVCHEAGVPVLSRGGGTSLAGQCCNEAVVLDWSKYCNNLVSVDV